MARLLIHLALAALDVYVLAILAMRVREMLA